MVNPFLDHFVLFVAVCNSGAYKETVDNVEHIERDLQKFRDATTQLATFVNRV